MKRVTIKDLARLLHLSPSTVSRALSDHPDISEETKNRVKKTAEKLNYTANLHASFFRNKRSGLIALIIPEINMFFTPNLIKGINKKIYAANYSSIVFLSNNSYKKEKEIIKQCLGWSVEGVLISLSKETLDLNHLEPLRQVNTKCVLFDKVQENEDFSTVTIDNIESGFKAVSHLLDMGHRNILGVFGNRNYNITKDRLRGYIRAFETQNVPIRMENIVTVDDSSELDLILPGILEKNKDITAIFTMSDEILAKCHFHISAKGMSIPDDISVITISDGQYPYLTYPNISFIKDSGSKMGKQASGLLLDLIKSDSGRSPDSLIVSTKLVKLDSVKNMR